jgi:AcrR family transcriptional regulator
MNTDVVHLPSRRDRVRAATSQEIVQTARRLLVEQGVSAVSLRAIAREMGMTAPALYRYYESHEELLRHVVADIFTELADHLHASIKAAERDWLARGQAAAATGQAADAAEPAKAATAAESRGQAGDQTPALIAVQLVAACRAFRGWALEHQPEFGMIFGSPLPGLELMHDDPLAECGFRFGQVFLSLFGELWRRWPFPAPADEELEPSLRAQLAQYHDVVGADLPLGVLQTFLRCWVLLYGTVSLEVFGHLRFALDDAAPLFELMMTDLAAMIGLDYPVLSQALRDDRVRA